MKPDQTLRIRSDTAELARVRKRVAVWAEAAGLSKSTGRRLQLAVDEAVANAIEHGVTSERQRVMVQGAPRKGRLTVTVRYRGPHFDPTTAPAPPTRDALRQRAAHGYGLHLIRTLVDNVSYRRDRDVNEVQLTAQSRRA